MTDADVDALGARYRALIAEAKSLRTQIIMALEACNRGDVDPGFGRELTAALANLEAMPDA